MSEQKFGDLSKVNLYGAEEGQLGELKQSQEDIIKSLERRYEQPNLFKISAALMQPRLGGFGAALGAASDVLGENIEKQRESQMPIAQMRAQLAQTNLLLGSKQKASNIIARAQKENRMLTPQEQEEVSNLDAERGQRLIQSQDVRSKTVANNMALTKQQYEARGLPMPPLNEMGLPDTGKFPTGGGNQGGAEPSRLMPTPSVSSVPSTSSGEINPLQRAQADVAGLDREIALLQKNNAGYPNGGQNALAALQQERANAQNRLNQLQGGSETQASNKPNEPTGEKVVLSSSTPSFSPLFTSEQVKEAKGLTDKQLNEGATKRYHSLEAAANPETYTQNKNAINAMIRTLVSNPDLAHRVTNPLAQKGGAIGAAMNAAEKGLGVSISGLAGNIHIPVQAGIIGSFDPKTERPYYDMLSTQAARISQIQQQMNNVNPGTIRNGEIDLYKNAGVSPSTQGPNVMLYNLQYTALNNDMLHEMYDRANKIMKNEDPRYVANPNSRTRMMDIMTSPVMSDIAASYDKRFKALDNQFASTLKGK
jgi:hypothetical protein